MDKMNKSSARPYPKAIKEMLGEKSALLSKAHALAEVGMSETAQPLWMAAASHEERLAPLLEALGRDMEAAVHRISAASCYQKAGDFSRAANLYRAALAGPLRDDTRLDIEKMLDDCLAHLRQPSARPIAARRVRKTVAA